MQNGIRHGGSRLACMLVSCLLLAAATGCATTIRPPARPLHPVTVYLTDEVVHSSVLMPIGGGRYVEYAFGDWSYAALDRHGPFHTFRALFFSPQGALGRRYVQLDRQKSPMAPELKGICLHPLLVDEYDMRALIQTLDADFAAGRSKAENPDNHFVFATVPDSYALWNNCNTLTKKTLRQMKCVVESRSPFAMYDVQSPAYHQ
jgi:hypothetical protein